MSHQVTIKDIARELGVSPSTVSRALKDHPDISAATKLQVRELVENCRDELVDGPHIQTEKEILAEQNYFESNQKVLFQFLDYLSALLP